MSNHDFDRAVNFLQGALNAATISAGDDSQTILSESTGPKEDSGPMLPGFVPPKEEPTVQTTEAIETPPPADPFTPPPEAIAPPLPGMVTTEPETPTPVTHIPAEKSPLELHPPAKKRAVLPTADNACAKAPPFRFNATIGLAALSSALGIGLFIALVCLLRTPEPPAAPVANDIPLALLPDSADPSLWETVSRMHGEIDGTPLAFERGQATDAVGTTYKVQLDFCRSGSDIYAKVAGEKTYVVRLDNQGTITKSYPAPRNNKPLKDIFGR